MSDSPLCDVLHTADDDLSNQNTVIVTTTTNETLNCSAATSTNPNETAQQDKISLSMDEHGQQHPQEQQDSAVIVHDDEMEQRSIASSQSWSSFSSTTLPFPNSSRIDEFFLNDPRTRRHHHRRRRVGGPTDARESEQTNQDPVNTHPNTTNGTTSITTAPSEEAIDFQLPTDFPSFLPSPNGSDDEEGENTNMNTNPRRRSIAYWITRILCFPVWLLVSVTMISSVFAFCIIPGIFVITLIMTCYYCCSRDPIPLDVLLQALFVDDDNESNPNNATVRTKEEIQALLICRKCTTIQRCSDKTDNGVSMEPPGHEAILANAPLTISTENYHLTFSEPITTVNSTDTNTIKTDETVNGDRNHINEWVVARDQYFSNDDHTSSVGAVIARSADSRDEEEGGCSSVEMTPIVRTTASSGGSSSCCGTVPEDGIATISSPTSPNEKTLTDDDACKPVDVVVNCGNHENHDDDDEYENGMGCDICLRRYECHEIVAWSKNENCIHAYHLNCITDWLQKKITCPNCRCHYIPNSTIKTRPNRAQQQVPNTNITTAVIPGTATNDATTDHTVGPRSSTAAATTAALLHQRSYSWSNV
jgi:Ring finger domain